MTYQDLCDCGYHDNRHDQRAKYREQRWVSALTRRCLRGEYTVLPERAEAEDDHCEEDLESFRPRQPDAPIGMACPQQLLPRLQVDHAANQTMLWASSALPALKAPCSSAVHCFATPDSRAAARPHRRGSTRSRPRSEVAILVSRSTLFHPDASAALPADRYVDWVTFDADILETGTEFYRLRINTSTARRKRS